MRHPGFSRRGGLGPDRRRGRPRRGRRPWRRRPAGLDTRSGARCIVGRPPDRVAEHVPGIVEIDHSTCLPAVVGVVFARKRSVRGPNDLRLGVRADLEHFVEVGHGPERTSSEPPGALGVDARGIGSTTTPSAVSASLRSGQAHVDRFRRGWHPRRHWFAATDDDVLRRSSTPGRPHRWSAATVHGHCG
jgi:hypothetical protein